MDLVDGIVMLQARTPTLPPATHTNSPLLGVERCVLVDPATPWPEEQQAFDAWLDAALGGAGGARVGAIFLTHHHHDHAGDAARLRDLLGAPIWAHALTAERLDVKVDRLIEDGEVIDLEDGFPLRALHTPGHAPGHLCLFHEPTRALVAGDMVAGVGSILIDPPEGHMGTYLASLDRLIGLSPRGMAPSHGFWMADGAGRLREQRAHREKRQAAVKAALPSTPLLPRELVPVVYGADTPPAMWHFAERSLRAALELCVERGEAVQHGEKFVRAG
jgi:glyoxylase-like metal-dependent hydrolase (beta-lactamase superfamily II)